MSLHGYSSVKALQLHGPAAAGEVADEALQPHGPAAAGEVADEASAVSAKKAASTDRQTVPVMTLIS